MAEPKVAMTVAGRGPDINVQPNSYHDEKGDSQSTSKVESPGNDELRFTEEGDDTATAGVRKVEAFNRVLYNSGRSGKILLLTLVVSIGLTMVGYSLDQGITSQFTLFAASFFGQHAQIGAVNTASQIIRAVSKPFIGKMADITSRPTTYVIVLVFYAVGFAVAASCTTIAAYIVGIAFTAFGKSGLDLLSDVIVGDLTTLQWRGLFSSLLSTPFLVTTFINAEIADSLIPDQWRWGLGLFAILMPALLLPAIFTLYAMQFKAKKQGMISMGHSGLARKGLLDKDVPSFVRLAWKGIVDIDLLGLVLLGFAFSLILLPFNLYKAADNGWGNPSMIAMLVVGFVALTLFISWEIYGAPKPAIPKRIMKNRAFLAAVGVNVTSQMASSDRFVYFSSYMYIIKPWSEFNWNIFLQTTTLALCVFGPICGLINAKTHRYKTLMVFGASMKLIGYGLCLNGARATQSTAALATSQVLLGMGSFQVVGARVGAQASVPHEDLATLIASLSLCSTLASSVGSTIATSIWQEKMLPAMREEAPLGTSDSTLRTIYGSIRDLRTDYDWDDPLRRSAIVAYTRTEGTIFIVGTIIAALSIVFCLFMPNYYLGRQQNAVTGTGLDGKPVDFPVHEERGNGSNGLWSRIKKAYYKES